MQPGYATTGRICVSLACFFFARALGAADASVDPPRAFDVPAGEAVDTLKLAARQGGLEIVFFAETVRGVRTALLRGNFRPRDALSRLVAGTGLVVSADDKHGTFTIQRATPPSAPTRAPPPNSAPANPPSPSPPVKRKNPIAIFGAWLAFAFALNAPVHAADSAPASLSGRVQHEVTGQYLNNARITIKGTDLTAFTDASGSFRLSNIPSGPVILEAFYSGLDPQQVALTLAPGQSAERDIALTNRAAYGDRTGIVKLDAFVFSSSRLTEGESLATNEQRFASNIKNVVATDAFGDVTEGNVAEFMKFLPGVSVEYSDAMPLALSVRGFDPSLTAVTMDGSQLANASGTGGSRQFDFTQVSINNMSRIEVTKVPTPANPADGISGSVNMVSKSAFERSRAQFNYRVFLSASSDGLTLEKQPHPFETYIHKVKPGFDFDYTLPIGRNFGIVLTGLSSKQFNEQNISQLTYNAGGTNTGATPARPYLQSHNLIDAPKWYNRDSVSLKADWRMTPDSVLSVSGQATYYEDHNGNLSLAASTGTVGTPSVAGGVGMSFGDDFVRGATGRGSVTMTHGFLHIAARTLGSNARYRFENGDWRIDAGLHASDSKTWRRFHEKGSFQRLSIALRNPVRVTFEGNNPTRPGTTRAYDNNDREVDLYDIRNYSMTAAAAISYGDHREDLVGGDLNVKRKLKLFGVPAALQAGGLQKVQTRDIRRGDISWDYTPPGGDRSPAPFLTQIYKNRQNYFGYHNVPWTSPNLAVTAWRQNPGLFTQTLARRVAAEVNRIMGSEKFEETVSAGYFQTETRHFQNRLTVLAGVRYEKTTDEGAGPLVEPGAVFVRTASGAFARDAAGNRIRKAEAGAAGSFEELALVRKERANRATRSYDGYYPSLHLTYNATEKLLVRAAYAKTYGRPNYSFVIPNTTISENDVEETADPSVIRGNISVRNTGLKPWTADNYDLSAEYYTEQGGVFSVGVFRKDIEDFFGSRVSLATAADLLELGLEPQYVGWNLSTTINVGNARVSGAEFSVRQSLATVGTWGRFFAVFVNGTKLKLEGNSQASFTGFMPSSLNWGVTYSRNPITIMAKWNHRGEQKRNAVPAMGPGAFAYNDPRTTLDLNVTYQLRKPLSFFANARNVFNVEHVQSRYGSSTPGYARTSSTASYGVQYAFGLKGTF